MGVGEIKAQYVFFGVSGPFRFNRLVCVSMGRKRRSRPSSTETHEASITRIVTTYFRVAQLGSPMYFLAILELNQLMRISHNPHFFGWLAFGQIRAHMTASSTIPSYLPQLAPYLTASAFYISNYVKKMSARARERYWVILQEVNRIVREAVFDEALLYGVDSHALREEDKRAHKAQLHVETRDPVPMVPGLCTNGRPHGRIVESLRGMVCTSCGRVGRRIYKQHFDDKQVSLSKLALMSSASNRMLPDGAMSTLVHVSDPINSITRGQFAVWIQRPVNVPYLDESGGINMERCASYTLPVDFQSWLLYLYDFVKDQSMDRSTREERINTNWAHAIWIYGYMIWLTVHDHALKSQSHACLVEKLKHQDEIGASVYQNPLQWRFRCLETHFVKSNVQYFRVRGSVYRFYPEKFLAPKFEESEGVLFADTNVRSLSRISSSQRLVGDTRARFWDGRYAVAIQKTSDGSQIRARATSTSDEGYFHIMVSKGAPIRFIAFNHGQYVLHVHRWEDPHIVEKQPRADHYFVHIMDIRTPGISGKLVYKLDTDEEQTLTISSIGPTMSRIVKQISNKIVLAFRPTAVTLTPTTKEWTQAKMP